MRVKRIRTLAGPNIYSHQPSLVMHLELQEADEKVSSLNPDFIKRLEGILPQVTGSNRRMRELRTAENALAETVKNAAVRLMNLAGFSECGGTVRFSGDTGIYEIAVEYKNERAATFLLETAVEIVKAALENEPFEISGKIVEAQAIRAASELGPSTRTIVEAAERRRIPWIRENENSFVQFGYGRNLRRIRAAMTDATSCLADVLVGNKESCKQRLAKFSIPVPRGETVRDEIEAIRAFKSIGAPVVVKPLNGNQGKGVSTNLQTEMEVVEAFRIAAEYFPRVLIEEQFEGKNYRVLVVNGKMEAASERLPVSISGDGASSIAKLIETENQNPKRGIGHEKPLSKIKINAVFLHALKREGYELNDVLPAGEKIILSVANNLSTGATARDVTDEVHRTVKILCERAARTAGMDVCGIDLIAPDISRPLPKTKAGIIEINSVPGLRMHAFPSEGKQRDVGGAIVEMLFPNGKEARIPIVAITGTNGKTTVTRLTAHVLLATDLNIGTATTDGILFNGESIVLGDTTGPASARMILDDPAVDIAVLETARGGIMRRGLGWDWADIAVVTNITEDHIGQDGIESVADLVNVKSLIAERVREDGTLILNADDAESAALINRPAVSQIKKRIVYFAMSEENPILKKHSASGETVYFVGDNWICEQRGAAVMPIAETTKIPIAMNGTADFQIQNAMAVVAVSRALDLPPEKIAAGLYSFQNEIHNPGRSNFYRVGKGYVLIDYGHNPKALEAICRMTARWTDKFITGIVSFPGDRRDDIIEAAGRIAVAGFDRIIVKGDVNLRGRKSGEVAEMLCRLVLEAGNQSECKIVLDATQAFEEAVAQIRENEVIVFFYEKLSPTLATLEKYDATATTTF
ncbi:MAG: cyanophycin synthetase [Acidobacteriota bacterium]|nr:cyanophycin synthetase [Acidobacteriota bacterium]